MTQYESLKDLFTFLKFKNNSKNHWSDSFGWEMVVILCDIVGCRMREVLVALSTSPSLLMRFLQLITLVGSKPMLMCWRSGSGC